MSNSNRMIHLQPGTVVSDASALLDGTAGEIAARTVARIGFSDAVNASLFERHLVCVIDVLRAVEMPVSRGNLVRYAQLEDLLELARQLSPEARRSLEQHVEELTARPRLESLFAHIYVRAALELP